MFTTRALQSKQHNCKVSLTLIHWKTFKANDKDAVKNNEKVALQIHGLQNYGNIFKIMDVTFLREHFRAVICRSEAKQSISCYLYRRTCKKTHFSQRNVTYINLKSLR